MYQEGIACPPSTRMSVMCNFSLNLWGKGLLIGFLDIWLSNFQLKSNAEVTVKVIDYFLNKVTAAVIDLFIGQVTSNGN